MQFIAQIPFGPDLFPGTQPAMAFLFMTDSNAETETWNPDGGENAVIILPRRELTNAVTVGDAPRLFRMRKRLWSKTLLPEAVVFATELSESRDPEFVPEEGLVLMSGEERESYLAAIQGNKLGGSPYFIQADELPIPAPWHLLLQLDSATVPFWINFGDAGVGHLFIDGSGRQGKFLWQCC